MILSNYTKISRKLWLNHEPYVRSLSSRIFLSPYQYKDSKSPSVSYVGLRGLFFKERKNFLAYLSTKNVRLVNGEKQYLGRVFIMNKRIKVHSYYHKAFFCLAKFTIIPPNNSLVYFSLCTLKYNFFTVEITEVLKKGQNKLFGPVIKMDNKYHICPYNHTNMIPFANDDTKFTDLDMAEKPIVLGQCDENGSHFTLEKVLGFRNDSMTQQLMTYAGIGLSDFFDSIHTGMKNVFHPWVPSSDDLKGRRDFKDSLSFTIDPSDNKDADDAISFKELGNGYHEVGVHIADVTYFYNSHPAEFERASQILFTCFLPENCLPMFSREFSTEKCSFITDVPRLTFSVVFTFSPTNEIIDVWIGKGFVTINRTFSNEEADKVIDSSSFEDITYLNNSTSENKPITQDLYRAMLKCYEISRKVKKNRHEVYRPVVMKPNKSIFDYSMISYPKSESLIEEFMILTNFTVSKKIFAHYKGNCLLRTQLNHSFKDLKKFSSFMEGSIELFNKFAEPENLTPLYISLITPLLQKAFYTTFDKDSENHHVFLGFPCYTHFTSPIRRFSDIIVHFQLANVLFGDPIPQKIAEEYEEYLMRFIDKGVLEGHYFGVLKQILIHEKIKNGDDHVIEGICDDKKLYLPKYNTTIGLYSQFTPIPFLSRVMVELSPSYKMGFKTIDYSLKEVLPPILSQEQLKTIRLFINSKIRIKKY